jgi:Cu-Zn family superoxide dismutase
VRTTVLVPIVAALLGGCAAEDPAGPAPSAPATGIVAEDEGQYQDPSAPPGVVLGTFLPYRPGATAATYDPAVVPAGATAEVLAAPAAGGVVVELAVGGMVPHRAYGAHLHTQPCAAVPAAAGPHYQHRRDPRTPSVDPAYANPRNEVWLDFTTDATGSAEVSATQEWAFTGTPPRSLVVHAQRTRTGPGEAGTAGDRAACMTLPG